MFNDIGNKIKKLASAVAWMGIIASIIIGIVLMVTDEELILLGLIIAIAGSISSWVGSFVLFGFGELVDNSTIIVQKLNDNSLKSNVHNAFESVLPVNQTIENKTKIKHQWNGKCQMCDTDDVMVTEAVITDDLGTRYRYVCDKCFEKYNCKQKTD